MNLANLGPFNSSPSLYPIPTGNFPISINHGQPLRKMYECEYFTYVSFGDDLEPCEGRRDARICNGVMIPNCKISALLEKTLNKFNPLQDILIWLEPSEEGISWSLDVLSSRINEEMDIGTQDRVFWQNARVWIKTRHEIEDDIRFRDFS